MRGFKPEQDGQDGQDGQDKEVPDTVGEGKVGDAGKPASRWYRRDGPRSLRKGKNRAYGTCSAQVLILMFSYRSISTIA